MDIDKLESVDTIKESLRLDPYVMATWISPSGNGLKALFYLEYDKPYPKADAWIYHEYCAFPKIENYLRDTYCINIDKTGGDITRLCFVSYDSEIHLKSDFEPFCVKCDLSEKSIKRIRTSYYSRKNIRHVLNEQRRIAKLLRNSDSLSLVYDKE